MKKVILGIMAFGLVAVKFSGRKIKKDTHKNSLSS